MNDDPYEDEATREYYDRKVDRAEEIIPYIVLLVIAALGAWCVWVVWDAVHELVR